MPIRAYDVDAVDPDSITAVAELSDFEVGDPVRYGDGETEVGVVLEVMTSEFPWPGAEAEGDGKEPTVDPDEVADGTIYIVAQGGGGSGLYEASELEHVEQSVFRPDDKSKETLMDDVSDAELGSAYPEDVACPDGECGKLMDVEELVSIPGVDDPGVGWDDFPDSWEKSKKPSRLILFDMWTSVGATFRGCRSRLAGRIGGNINKFCAATKDEIWQSTHWRSLSD